MNVQMHSIDVAGVLQETGDAESKALENIMIPVIFTSIFLICVKDIMIIVLLQQMMRDVKVGGGSFMLGYE